MSGVKITGYPNTQTTFDDLDLFDVSAYIAPDSPFESRKYSWSTLVSQMQESVLPTGTNGQIFAHDSTDWIATSNIFINFSLNKVGIFTSSPLYALHVNSNVASSTFRDTIAFFNQTNVNALRGEISVYYGGQIRLGIVKGSSDLTGFGSGGDTYLRGDGEDLNIIGTTSKNINFYHNGTFNPASENPAFQINSSAITAREILYAKGANDDYSGLTLYASSLFQIKDGAIWNSTFNGNGYTSGLYFNAYGLTNPGSADSFLEVEINGVTLKLLAKQ